MFIYQCVKSDAELAQHINYLALALMDLAANDKPMEEEIQAVERELEIIIEKYSAYPL